MSFKENSKIYYGLDIGTDSVGWSTTNEKYELLRYKNNLMWGVSLFEAASLAEDRRDHRTQRRRYDRRQQRVALLGELFAKEILKTDPDFFLRLKESSLYPEDRTSKNVNTYFDDADFKDSDYFKMYPTVHHLIKELSESNKPHDVRLVYLACAFIVAHRGHFLNGADENNVQAVLDFDSSYCEFTDWFKSNDIEDNPFSESVKNEFSVIIRKKIGITAKEREIKNLLFGTTKTPDCYKDEEYPIDIDVLIKFISGGKTNLAKLFRNPSYDELDIQTVEVGKADFADTIDLLASSMEDTDVPLLSAVKAMYDWSLLIDVLKGQKTISDAKVCEYEQHKSDLKALKYIVRKYLDRALYDEIFRTAGEKPNYVSYSYNVTDVKLKQLPSNFKKKNSEEFCKYIKSKLEKIKPESDDEAVYNELIEKCNSKTLCPKQVTDENRVIPYQLYYHELRYCYKRKGELFDQQPKKAGNPDLAYRKKNLDPVKYGGYNSKSISCFSLIKCTGVGAVIIPVELLCEKRYFSDDSFASEYAYSVLKNALPAKNIAKISIDDISFPLKRRPIKISTLFEFDGYRVNIRSKDSYHYFTISSAMAAIYSKDTSDYIKAVSSYIDKSDKGSKFKPGEAFDVLSNLKVYDEIAKKCISEPFSKISKLAEAGKKMEEGRDKFAELSIIEQMKTLLLLVDILKTGRINTCNLKPVGGVESYHTERMSAILKNTKYSDIRIIDQSPTGLYEKKSDNLLEL